MSAFLKRRDFLVSLSTVGVAAAFGPQLLSYLSSKPKVASQRSSTLIGAKYQLFPDFQPFAMYPNQMFKDNYVFKWDVKKNNFETIKINGPAHYCEQHPIERSIVACPSRFSDRISIFDWKTQKEAAVFTASDGHYFYGHAAFNDNGSLVLAPLSKNGNGFIYIFETEGLKVVDIVQMGPNTAHDIQTLGNNKFVFGLTSLPSVDTVRFGVFDLSQKKFDVFSQNMGQAGQVYSVNHMKQFGHTVFASNNVRENGLLTTGNLVKFNTETHAIESVFDIGVNTIATEIFNVEYDHETDYLWLSVPFDNNLLVWNAKADKLVASISESEGKRQRSCHLVTEIDAMVVGFSRSFKAYDRKTIREIPSLSHDWSKDNLKDYIASHTRIY